MRKLKTERIKRSHKRSCLHKKNAPHRRAGKTRKRLAFGGGAAAVLVLLYFFGGQFGVGIGGHDGNSPVTANNSGKQLQNVSTPSNEETKTDWYHDGVVRLRTKKDGYEINTSQQKDKPVFASVDVERLKELITKAPGNSQGVKVRISIAHSSTPKIEEQLETILREMKLIKDRDYLFVK